MYVLFYPFLCFFTTIKMPATFIFIVLVFVVYFILFSISSSLQLFLCGFYPFISLLFSPFSLYSVITYSYTLVTSFYVLRQKTACSFPPTDLFRCSCPPYCSDLSSPGHVQKYSEATERSLMGDGNTHSGRPTAAVSKHFLWRNRTWLVRYTWLYLCH